MAEDRSSKSEHPNGHPGRDARDIARRNRDAGGKGLSPVMKTAATACEVGHEPPARRRGPLPTSETD